MSDAPTAVPKLALSIEQACQALTISRPTLYELIGADRLRTVRAGRRRLVPVAEIERFLAAEND
jgi:excisionase family DNA binding protein